MGEASKFKDKHTWLTVAIFVVVIALAGGAGVGLRWWQNNHQPKTAVDTVRSVQQQAVLNKDPKAAEAAIDDALKKDNLSKQDKYYLYFQKGSAYHDQKDYKQAIDNYKLAAENWETDNIYEAMGIASASMGDKAQAIKYYERAIQLVPADSPVRNMTKERLQRNIDTLNGKPVEGPPASIAQ